MKPSKTFSRLWRVERKLADIETYLRVITTLLKTIADQQRGNYQDELTAKMKQTAESLCNLAERERNNAKNLLSNRE